MMVRVQVPDGELGSTIYFWTKLSLLRRPDTSVPRISHAGLFALSHAELMGAAIENEATLVQSRTRMILARLLQSMAKSHLRAASIGSASSQSSTSLSSSSIVPILPSSSTIVSLVPSLSSTPATTTSSSTTYTGLRLPKPQSPVGVLASEEMHVLHDDIPSTDTIRAPPLALMPPSDSPVSTNSSPALASPSSTTATATSTTVNATTASGQQIWHEHFSSLVRTVHGMPQLAVTNTYPHGRWQAAAASPADCKCAYTLNARFELFSLKLLVYVVK
jgi:hypothetical protein